MNEESLRSLDQCIDDIKNKIQGDITCYLEQETKKYADESSNVYMIKYGLLSELLDELKSKIDIGDD